LLQCARDEGYPVADPLTGIRPLRHVPKRRPLYSTEEIERLATIGETVCPTSGRTLANFLRVCAYSGIRCSEAMRLRWTDVDWGNQRLIVGSDGLTKNHESRTVEFNPRLEEVLRDMKSAALPESEFLFSPPRKADQPYRNLRQTLQTARTRANMEGFGFHDCRHHFVSVSVMSGIDYLTIARWVGHKDGGILIGKVYGHLSAEHLKKAAMRLAFRSTGST
jgi:integrase